jgi:hypothetical protein
VTDVADALMHILNLDEHRFEPDYGGAKCPVVQHRR